jgi:hypothetical protein
MNLQEKKIQGLKQKNRELTKTKMIFKPLYNAWNKPFMNDGYCMHVADKLGKQ